MPACGQARMERKKEKKIISFLAEVKPELPPYTHSSLAPSHQGREERSNEGEALGEAKGLVLLQDCEELQPWCSFWSHRTWIFLPNSPSDPGFLPSQAGSHRGQPMHVLRARPLQVLGANPQEAPSLRSRSFQTQARHLQEQQGEAPIHTISHWGWRPWAHFSAESSRAGARFHQRSLEQERGENPQTAGTGSEQSHKEQTEITISS